MNLWPTVFDQMNTHHKIRIAIAAAFLATVGAAQVTKADAVYSWAFNASGQLGTGSPDSTRAPVAVPSLSSGVTEVAAGGDHSLAIQNGSLLGWGLNNLGQLATGNTTSSNVPVATLLNGGVTQIAGGGFHSLVVQNGGLYGFGRNGSGQTGFDSGGANVLTPTLNPTLGSGVTAVAGGMNHSLAIRNGAVYGFGFNGNGQTGVDPGTDGEPVFTPTLAGNLSSGATAIAAGSSHSVAVVNGGVFSFGSNARGQLGNDSFDDSFAPVAAQGLSSGVTSIAAGATHTLAVQNGRVFSWGSNINGELGVGTQDDSAIPLEVPGLSNVTEVAAGVYSSYALTSDGNAYVWGANYDGELGLGTNEFFYTTPQLLLAPTGYKFTGLDSDAFGGHVLATVVAVPEPVSLAVLVLGGMTLLRRQRTT